MAFGAFDIFLKLDNIEGESKAKGHEKEIVVLSYEQGIDTPTVISGGSGIAVGRADFSGVRFRKPLDKASIPLLIAAAAGSTFNSARFSFRRAGATADFYKVTLSKVVVTHMFQRAGTGAQYPLSFTSLESGANDKGFLDEVTFLYRTILWEYAIMGPKGSVSGTVKGGWDLVLNKKI
jgi:type VI secretion system secreted protein Hcp